MTKTPAPKKSIELPAFRK